LPSLFLSQKINLKGANPGKGTPCLRRRTTVKRLSNTRKKHTMPREPYDERSCWIWRARAFGWLDRRNGWRIYPVVFSGIILKRARLGKRSLVEYLFGENLSTLIFEKEKRYDGVIPLTPGLLDSD
jgi:hypothetical protein